MKKIQYNYLPADSASAGNSRETKNSRPGEAAKMPPPPDEATVARLNAIGREYPFCAWYKSKNNTLL
jgi:hypothetical protein